MSNRCEWVGQCGIVTPYDPIEDGHVPGEGYRPGDVDDCLMCENADCTARVRRVAPAPVFLPDPLPDPESIERPPPPSDPNDDEGRRHRFEKGPRPGKALRF